MKEGTWTRYAWLRPELAKSDDHKHKTYWVPETEYERTRQVLLNAGAGHRLAFLAASMPDGFFIDVRQECSDLIPFPEDGKPFCAIIGDSELEFPPTGGSFIPDLHRPGAALPGPESVLATSRIIGKGPDQFDQASLKKMFALARHVTLDVTCSGQAAFYLRAAEPMMIDRENVIYIETSGEAAQLWLNFVNNYTFNCTRRLITDVDTELITLAEETRELQ